MTDADVHCSFCEKPKSAVAHLVAGPSAAICDECIAACRRVLGDEPSPAQPEPLGAPAAVRAAIRELPRPASSAALAHLASVGLELAGTSAPALRALAYDLSNAMAFEDALRVRTRIAPFERTVADQLAEAAYQTRLGAPRDAVATLEKLATGPLAARLSPSEAVALALARAYARLAAGGVFENDVRAIEDEAARAAASLPTLDLDEGYRRALENQHVHVRARAAIARHQDDAAVAILTEHLGARELDIEALVLLVEAYERRGDRVGVAAAREKALRFAPAGSAYARRIG